MLQRRLALPARRLAASVVVALSLLFSMGAGVIPAQADENCVHGNGGYWADPFTRVTFFFAGQNTYYYGSSLYHEHHYYETWINWLPFGGVVWQGDVYMGCPLHR
jgi:hypothetical protein